MLNREPKLHPLAELFPPMTDVEYQALKKDIAENGQEDRVTFWNGMLVDGRHRWRACKDLGVECDAFDLECDEGELYQYVLSKNLHRRHLTESQRAMTAGKLAKLKVGDNQHSKEGGQICPPSLEQAAEMLNVGRRSVVSAKQVLDAGAPEIVAAVEAGELPVSFAAKVVTEEDDKKTQAKLWKQGGKQALKEHIKRGSDCADDAKRVLKKEPLGAPKSVTQQCENEVNEFLLFWEKRTAKGKKAIWLWLVDHYESS